MLQMQAPVSPVAACTDAVRHETAGGLVDPLPFPCRSDRPSEIFPIFASRDVLNQHVVSRRCRRSRREWTKVGKALALQVAVDGLAIHAKPATLFQRHVQFAKGLALQDTRIPPDVGATARITSHLHASLVCDMALLRPVVGCLFHASVRVATIWAAAAEKSGASGDREGSSSRGEHGE